MGTTINDLVDRRGGAYRVEELEDVLNRARRLLADISALLELEIERLFDTEIEPDDRVRIDNATDMIRQTQKAMATILEIEAKAGLSAMADRNAMDLEAARDEILRRLARLTPGKDAPGVS